MPKLLDQIQNKIIEVTKKHIFEEGICDISLRAIAKECEIAPSTIYNYFKNKDDLIAMVISEDWFEVITKMDNGIEESSNVEEAFSVMYLTMRDFVRKYMNVWSQFQGSMHSISSRHHLLLNQIKTRVEIILDKYEYLDMKNICNVLSETILTCSTHSEINEDEYLNFIKIIFK